MNIRNFSCNDRIESLRYRHTFTRRLKEPTTIKSLSPTFASFDIPTKHEFSLPVLTTHASTPRDLLGNGQALSLDDLKPQHSSEFWILLIALASLSWNHCRHLVSSEQPIYSSDSCTDAIAMSAASRTESTHARFSAIVVCTLLDVRNQIPEESWAMGRMTERASAAVEMGRCSDVTWVEL